jgi:pilus assembly protein CpaE
MHPLTAGLVVESKELREAVREALEPLPIRLLFELAEIPQDWPVFLERLDRVRPDVILLDITRFSEQQLEDSVKRIRGTAGNPVVFALHTSAEPATILAALRAGASEYLYPPMADPLATALTRHAEQRRQTKEKITTGGKVIGFVSAKGGCGATTIASHVAVELTSHSQGKVLLADLDLQSGLLGFLFKAKSPYSIADAVNNLQKMDYSYWQGLVSNGIPKLELITAPATPSTKQISPAHLKQVIAFAKGQYEWTVLDLGRNLTPATLAMLDGVDETYLVVTHEVPALHQAKQMIQVLLDTGYPAERIRLVLNRTSKRFDVTLEELERMLGLPIYATIENDFNRLHEAFSDGRLVDRNTTIGEDFARLAARIAGVSAEPAKKKKFLLFG